MITYKYAKNEFTEIVDILKINKDHNSQFFCISCGEELIPRTGEQRQHHFAHKSNTSNCSKETYLHKLSKEALYQFLKNSIDNRTPFPLRYMREICQFFDNISCISCKSQEEYNLLNYYHNIYLEKSSNGFVPDILLETKDKSNRLFIEIAVFHKSSEEKKKENKIIEILIENENDIFEIINSGISDDDNRISLYNFRKDVIHLEKCNENNCTNYVDCIQSRKKDMVPIRSNIFRFNEQKNNPRNNIIYKLSEKEFQTNGVMRYLNKYSKDKKKINAITTCKYPVINNEYNYYLLIGFNNRTK